ncbi:MAG: ABC transporter substrate-binding protein [Planctomycetota bacterium]
MKIIIWVVVIVALLGFAHIWINVGFDEFADDVSQMIHGERQELVIGFLPVTCHITCPVIDYTNRKNVGAFYEGKRYSDFPTMCEDLKEGTLTAAFLNAPLAVRLAAEEGVPCKFVSLGHRDGSAIIVGKDSPYQSIKDLKGKKILIPSKASNQQLWLAKLCKENGLLLSDFNTVTCPPPDMPVLLGQGQCDAYIVGEPHAARSELQGTGRVLYQAKDSWPNFISCGLVVRNELLRDQPELIQKLVDGIHGSGLWLEEGVENRFAAAEVVGKYYYNQPPELLKFVLSKPIDRVRYDHLTPLKEDFEEIIDLGVEIGMFKAKHSFDAYADPSFAVAAVKTPIPMPSDDGLGLGRELKLRPPTPKPDAAPPAGGAPAPAPAPPQGATPK